MIVFVYRAEKNALMLLSHSMKMAKKLLLSPMRVKTMITKSSSLLTLQRRRMDATLPILIT